MQVPKLKAYFILSLIPVLLCLLNFTQGLPAVVRVGALFSPDEQSEDLVYKIALEKTNKHLSEISMRTSLDGEMDILSEMDAASARTKTCQMVRNAVSAVIGPTNPISALGVRTVCDRLGIPHIQTQHTLHLAEPRHTINFFPHPFSLMDAYVDLIQALKWDRFAFVYDDNVEILYVDKFSELARAKAFERLTEEEKAAETKTQKRTPEIRIYQAADSYRSFRDVFWEIKQIKMDKIVLHVKTENLYTALKQAQQVGMLTEDQNYIVTSLDLHTIEIEDFKYSQSNIFYYSLINENNLQLGDLLYSWPFYARNYNKEDLPPPISFKTSTVLIHDALNHFGEALIASNASTKVTIAPIGQHVPCNAIEPWIYGDTLINQLLYVMSAGITGNIRFHPITRRRVDVMLYLHKLDSNGLTKVGNWTDRSNIGLLHVDPLVPPPVPPAEGNALSLKGKTLIVTTYINAPFTMRVKSKETLYGNDQYEGYCIDIVKEMSKYLGFEYKIHINKEESSGSYKNATGLWNGLIGDVIYNRADFAIVDLTLTKSRQTVADFTQPFMNTGIQILYAKASTSEFSPIAFLDPFSNKVWYWTIAITVLVSVVKHIVGRFSPYEWCNTMPCRQEDGIVENSYNMRNSFWFTMGSLLQQGSDVAPRAFSTRFIAVAWYFFTLILSQSYTANLASFLTVDVPTQDFADAEGLLKAGNPFGCKFGGSTCAYFKNSNHPVYSKLGEKIKEYEEKEDYDCLPLDNAKGVERAANGTWSSVKYAFFMEAAALEYQKERSCNLTAVGPKINDISYSIAVKKGSTLLRNLDAGILHLKEKGLLDRFYTKWWKEKGGSVACPKKGDSDLELASVGGVFIVLGMGMVCSLLMAIGELAYHLKKENAEEPVWPRMKQELWFAFDFRNSKKSTPKKSDSTEQICEEDQM